MRSSLHLRTYFSLTRFTHSPTPYPTTFVLRYRLTYLLCHLTLTPTLTLTLPAHLREAEDAQRAHAAEEAHVRLPLRLGRGGGVHEEADEAEQR